MIRLPLGLYRAPAPPPPPSDDLLRRLGERVLTSGQGLVPNARAVVDYIQATYPGVLSIGGVRQDALPDHPSGRAVCRFGHTWRPVCIEDGCHYRGPLVAEKRAHAIAEEHRRKSAGIWRAAK